MTRRSAWGIIPSVLLFIPFSAGHSSSLPGNPNIFVELSKKVVPSVVNISNLSRPRGMAFRGGPEDFFRRFFEDHFGPGGPGAPGGRGRPMPPRPMPDDDDEMEEGPGPRAGPGGKQGKPQPVSLGTGFIIDASGLILTNHHVVDGADEIRIQFTEDFEEVPTEGKVVGRDEALDLALIRVKTNRKLVPLVLGNSDALQVGEYVAAVGNPFGQGHSVTHGIVSAKGRKAPDFQLANYIQTDAPINPGNSGGPLVNLKGEVIGINNAIDQRAQGIGFAIPVNLVKEVLPQLKTKGKVSRGYIGVLIDQLNPDIAEKIGAPKDLVAPFVTQVNPGEPADAAGVKPYDVIVEFAGKKVKSATDLVTAVTSVAVGETTTIKVLREGTTKELKIKLTERPGNEELAQEGRPGKKGPIGKGPVPEKSAAGLTLEANSEGVLVTSTAYGGPADRAGILRGDIILEVDRKSVKSPDDFFKIAKDKKTYMVRVKRTDPRGQEGFLVILLDLK
ncbi:MAG: trypsin-like peptidase domain-containing protein [Bdellovibrionales bacterium]|nr:trypsin-like peptidase domain-containing protein [Bdellovibrionales bacterium]